jgi:AraC-like DNA-binding protein
MKTTDCQSTAYDRQVQPDWLTSTRAVIRAISDDLALADLSEFTTLIWRSLDTIEGAPDRLHSAVLALMLLDACSSIVQAIHKRQPSMPCSCHAAAWEHLRLLTRFDDTEPRVAFWNWAERFLARVAAEHPTTPAQQAAVLMRANPVKPWTLRDLANETATYHVRLSRQFEKVFGLRPAAYLHLVRVARAVPLFRTSAKVEAIALEVGYRSKKDFYAALKRWIGLTPNELRALPNEESKWLARELRRRCLESLGSLPYPGGSSEDYA